MLAERLLDAQNALKQAVKMGQDPAKQVKADQNLSSTSTNCPYCGSTQLRNKGPRENKDGSTSYRYECKTCNQGFSIKSKLTPRGQKPQG